MSNIDDFGFSFEDTQENNSEAMDVQSKRIEELETALLNVVKNNREMYRKVAVLLTNLKKNPEKPMINWPDRVKKIDAFLAELETLREKG